MPTPDFTDYLDAVTNGIFFKKERESVKAELADHLYIKYELLTAQGKSAEEAVKAAEEAMGDRNALRHTLSQVHSYRPDISMKKAVHLLMAGLILSVFHINFFDGMELIENFIASVCTLTGVYCLSKANGTLKKSFGFYTAHTVLMYARYAFTPFIEDKPAAAVPVNAAQTVFLCLGFIFLMKGLKELVMPYTGAPHKPLNFNAATVLCTGSYIYGRLTTLLLTQGNSAYTATPGNDAIAFILPGVVMSVTGVVITLVLLFRVNRLLYAADHEYQIEDSPKKKALFAVCTCVFAVGLSLITGYFYLKPSPALTVYEPDGDKNVEQTMKTYQLESFDPSTGRFGEPEDIFSLLPKKETARYSDLAPLRMPQEEQDNERYYNTRHYGSRFEEAYAFPINEEHGEFRLLRRIILPEDSSGCRAILSTQTDNSGLIPMNNDDTFILILSRDEYGRLCEQKPLKTYRDDLGVIYAFEFTAKPGTQIIIGKTYAVSYPGHRISFNYATYMLAFDKPVFGLSRSVMDIIKKRGSDIYYVSPSSSYTSGSYTFLMYVPFAEQKTE